MSFWKSQHLVWQLHSPKILSNGHAAGVEQTFLLLLLPPGKSHCHNMHWELSFSHSPCWDLRRRRGNNLTGMQRDEELRGQRLDTNRLERSGQKGLKPLVNIPFRTWNFRVHIPFMSNNSEAYWKYMHHPAIQVFLNKSHHCRFLSTG